jgi:hypothetical protein
MTTLFHARRECRGVPEVRRSACAVERLKVLSRLLFPGLSSLQFDLVLMNRSPFKNSHENDYPAEIIM